MESQISPKNIEARVEAMAAAEKETPAAEVKAPEVKAPETPEVKAPEVKAPEVKAPEVKAPEVKVEVKAPEVKAPEKKKPNDPDELRKWSTKLSQENAQLREDMKTIKAALEKMTKKPIDYAAIAKDPESLKAHIEQEKAEAVRDLQEELKKANNQAVQNETLVAKMELEKDTENYPRWGKLFPLIQNLAANTDGRINFQRAPREVLHDLYTLAEQLSPAEAVAAPVAPVVPAPVAPVAPALTEEQIQARIAAAVAEAVTKAKTDSAAGIRAEQDGAGIGGAGKGGRRDNKVSKEALQKMPLNELKAMISKE